MSRLHDLLHATSLPRTFVEPDLGTLNQALFSIVLVCLLWTGGSGVPQAVGSLENTGVPVPTLAYKVAAPSKLFPRLLLSLALETTACCVVRTYYHLFHGKILFPYYSADVGLSLIEQSQFEDKEILLAFFSPG